MKPVNPPVLLSACAGLCLTATGTVAPLRAAPIFSEAGYSLVYDLAIPNFAAFDRAGRVPYSVDNSASIPNSSFNRVGYMLQLQTASGTLQTVAVSMNAFTNKASLLGVPTLSSGGLFNNVPVVGMIVMSNVAGVATGRGFSTGYVQFWSNCYGNIGGTYATGRDVINPTAPACYGSMQIGNGIGNTVFAYNAWDYGIFYSDLGIGNHATDNTDWTFSFNAATYVVKNLSVWIATVPEPGSLAVLLAGVGIVGLVRRRG
jgi:sialate O-acetylesterase